MEELQANNKPDEQLLKKGRFFAVYIEPIRFSGERITIAVAAELLKERHVVCTLSNAKIACIYNSYAPGLTSLVELTVSSLKEHIYDNGQFEGWTPPFSGVSTSDIKNWKGHSFETLIYVAVKSTSSMYQGDLQP